MVSRLERFYERVRDAMAWRVRKALGDPLVDRTLVRIAYLWRPFLRKPVFIGITGSLGKTTTKDLLLEVLSPTGRGVGTPGTFNVLPWLAKTILSVRPTHNFCVVELSESMPGEMDQPLALLQPSVAIVTLVGSDHLAAYDSIDALAGEMGKLVASLPATGCAVLNADDARVLAMAATCPAKVITYGVSPGADLRAESIRATWPGSLGLTLVRGTERVAVATPLCGPHWTTAILAAVGGGLALGMSLEECATQLARVAPAEGRMQPVGSTGGVTFIRDDFKAPLGTVDACLDFLRMANAKRKIIVIGSLSDYGGASASKTYRSVAKRAQQVAEIAIFVGPWASSVLRARMAGREGGLVAFDHVREAADYVNSIARDGDLILLKGTNKQDHLLRIIMARTGEIECWRDDCKLFNFCTGCKFRGTPSGLPSADRDGLLSAMSPPSDPSESAAIGPAAQVLVGLGNPGAEYVGTPHNLGYEFVDRFAAKHGLTWETSADAWVAVGDLRGYRICLVKLRTVMNQSGPVLSRLAARMSFAADNCILVHDDLDLPLGSLRGRLRGGSGGHRGVASILEAFQTNEIRRLKLGIKKDLGTASPAEYVLTALDRTDRALIDDAMSRAEEDVLALCRVSGSVAETPEFLERHANPRAHP